LHILKVIAEFERKGIDEKYYKDLGEEGKVKNKAVAQEYKLKKQKEFLSEFRALALTLIHRHLLLLSFLRNQNKPALLLLI
jgi:hypothetical protein